MASDFPIPVHEGNAERVQDMLQSFLAAKTVYTDRTLPEFIVTMVQNGRSVEEIKESLDEFLGDDLVSVMEWIANDLPKLYADGEQKEREGEGEGEKKADDDDKVDFGQDEVTKGSMDEEESVIVPSKAVFVSGRGRGNERARERGRGRGGSLYNARDRYERGSERGSERGERGDRSRRGGRGERGGKVSFTVTFGNKGTERTVDAKEKRGMKRSMDDREIDEALESEPPLKRTKPSTPKCTFWPFCTKGDACPFFHPTEPCTMFPKCKFGDKCHYIHPAGGQRARKPQARPAAAPCRYGFSCHRRTSGCFFSHPAPPCRYGNACKRRSSCKFSHAILCRNGAQCTRPECSFAHGEATVQSGVGIEKPEVIEAAVASLDASLPPTPPKAVASAVKVSVGLAEAPAVVEASATVEEKTEAVVEGVTA